MISTCFLRACLFNMYMGQRLRPYSQQAYKSKKGDGSFNKELTIKHGKYCNGVAFPFSHQRTWSHNKLNILTFAIKRQSFI